MDYSEVIRRIDGLRERIIAHGPMSDEVRKKVHYKFRLDWNYYSNSMEGNTLTMDETRSVMVGNLTVGGKPLKDVLEMKGHDEVVSTILSIGKGDVRLSEARIMEIHRAIMHEDDPDKRRKIGTWKPEANYMFNYKDERFDFVAPDEVPERMHDLLNRTNAAIDAIVGGRKKAPHPVDVALRFHLDYVAIHPFYDGNGRTARILTNLLLISCGYPPFWVKTDEREAYGRYLGDIQAYGGNPDLFLSFAGKLILRSQQLMLDAMEGRGIEEDDDLVKRVSLLKGRLLIDRDEDKVQIEWNEESALTLFKERFVPLIEVVNEFISPIEQLVKTREIRYSISSDKLVFESLQSVTIWLSDNLIPDFIHSITLRSLRDQSDRPFQTSASYRIVFQHLIYEIYGVDDKILVSKPYHQQMTEDEMRTVGKTISNALISAIEARLDADRP